MKLQARVKTVTGKTVHYLSQESSSNQSGLVKFPPADRVEIVEEDDGYYLFRYSMANEFAGDSWFASIDECMRQAKFEYGIEEDDWKVAT